MLKTYNLFAILVLLFNWTPMVGQDQLTFDDALKLTLENNYNIQMSKINEQIAANNASKRNNNYLPSLSATGAYNWTFFGGSNEFLTGEQDYDANNSYNYNAGVSLNYTVFDGQGRKFNYLQMQEAKSLTSLQVRQLIENTIVNLSSVYYEVNRLRIASASLQESMRISSERYKRAELDFEYGQSSQLDVLSAQVDLNTDSINLLNTIQLLGNTKRQLNLLMGESIDVDYILDEEIVIEENLVEQDIIDKALLRNVDLQSMASTMRMSQYAIKSAKSVMMPRLDVNAGYNYRGTDDPNGAFVIGSYNTGPLAGVSLSWILFNGSTKIGVENAKLNLESTKIEQTLTAETVKLNAMNAFGNYKNALFVWRAQQDNVDTAIRNFQRNEEAFKLGQISSVEFRQAQANLLQARLSLSQSMYNAKNAEWVLLAISGGLLE